LLGAPAKHNIFRLSVSLVLEDGSDFAQAHPVFDMGDFDR
jgi:hypothetical protein